MTNYVTGSTIKMLREVKKITQKQLADILCVSDKAISKWETGRGLPDITLIEPLSKALSVSVSELLTGECKKNTNKSSNLLKSVFYVCPVCGNVIYSIGEGTFSCCGVTLPVLEKEEVSDEHKISAEKTDGEYFVSLKHSMTKEHYISFIAFITDGSAQIVKLYPQQNCECRFALKGKGKIYAYCNRHGLFEENI